MADLGKVTGTIELEDKISHNLDVINSRLNAIDKSFGGMGGRVAEYAAGFFTAEAALNAVSAAVEFAKDKIVELTVEGAGAADIAGNFDHLTESAGRLGSTLLTTLNEGLHNTVTDLELMKLVNQDLAAGLNLTDEQFKTIADGAFALAQATGTDVKEALETVNDALLTGRTRGVQYLTGKIDMTKAEEEYAISLGTTVDRLTQDEKLEAARLAILNKVSEATARLGEQTDGLDEIVAQVMTAWSNFNTELAISVATSPVMVTLFTEVKNALAEAFGGNQQDLIKTVTGLIEDGAIKAVEFGQIVADAVGIAGMTWNSFRIILETVAQGWRAIEFVIGTVVVKFMELAQFLSGGALDFSSSIAQGQQHLDELYNTMAEGENRIAGFREAQDKWAVASGNVRDKLEAIRLKLLESKAATEAGAQAQEELKGAQDGAATSANNAAEAQGALGHATRRSAEEAKAFMQAWDQINDAVASGSKTLAEVLKTMDVEIVKAAKSYLDLGISLDKVKIALELTDSQAKAINESWQEQQKLLDQAKEKSKEMAAAQKELAQVARGLDMALQGVGSRTIEDVKHFMQMGVSLETLRKAYGLTEVQIAAIADELTKGDAAWKREHENLQISSELVRTLAGEYITLEEAQKRRQAGGSFDVTKANLVESARWWRIPEGFAVEWAKKGASFQEIIKIWNNGNPIADWVVTGPRIPGFREGGWGDFGEGTLAMLHGKEAIVPLDKTGGLGNINQTFYINGTAAETAKKVSEEIMRTLKRFRQFGSA